MSQEVIGTRNGQQYFVGGTPPPIVARYPTPTPPAPTPAVTPTPTTDTSAAATIPSILSQADFNANRTGGVDENAIKESTRKSMQATIDAIDAQYANLIGTQQQANEGNLGKTRALNARSGLQDSDFGAANTKGQEQANSQAIKALEDEKALKIAAVNTEINKSAREEAAAKKAEALGNADAYASYLDKQRTGAQGQLKTLGESGTTVEELRTKSPAVLGYLKKALGMTDFQVQQELSTAASGKLKTDTKILGDTAYASVYNPATGKFETHVQQFDLPDGSLVDFGNGKIMVKNVDENGKATYTDALPKEKTLPASAQEYEYAVSQGYKGSYNDYQTMDANRKRSVTNINGGGLSPYQQFEAVTKLQTNLTRASTGAKEVQRQYTNMKSAYDRLDKGEAKDLNGTSQVIINSFNKINDPNSVIRESEYARSPEGQSLIASLEGKANALAQGGAGLTKDSLKEFVNLSKILADNAKQSIEAQNTQAIATAKKFGLDTSLVDSPLLNSSPDANLSDEDAYQLYLKTQK